MPANELLTDAFDRIRQEVDGLLDGLTADQLTYRPDPEANTIAWLVWHLTRVQDDHVAGVADTEQVWTAGGWAARFSLPWDEAETGYGQEPGAIEHVRVEASLLRGYHDAVAERTAAYVRGLDEADLDRVVDERWDPPVTLAVRLVSVIADDLQHAGQAAYVRGLVERS